MEQDFSSCDVNDLQYAVIIFSFRKQYRRVLGALMSLFNVIHSQIFDVNLCILLLNISQSYWFSTDDNIFGSQTKEKISVQFFLSKKQVSLPI
jgi:hypothetical protein